MIDPKPTLASAYQPSLRTDPFEINNSMAFSRSFAYDDPWCSVNAGEIVSPAFGGIAMTSLRENAMNEAILNYHSNLINDTPDKSGCHK
jgi:hypothetical protein